MMKDIDGGLHPAVDGQSLDEDEDDNPDVIRYGISIAERQTWVRFLLTP